MHKPGSNFGTVRTQARFTTHFTALFLSQLGVFLTNGFSLRQSVHFFQALFPKQRPLLAALENQLAAGEELAAALAALGMQTDLTQQIQLAQQHGQLAQCLKQLGRLQQAKQQQLRKLQQLLAYPCVILIFLGILMILVKVIVLPEITGMSTTANKRSLADWVWLGLGMLFLSGLLWMGLQWFLLRQLPLEQRLKKQLHWPIVGPLLKLYHQYCLTFDLALLIGNGLHLEQMLQLTTGLQEASLLSVVGTTTTTRLKQGASLNEIIRESPFIPSELDYLIVNGGQRQQMAREVGMLAQLRYEQLLAALERALIHVQPLIFVVIAVMIVCVYLSILLPLYQMMEGL
ncbi:bacterial type II secretion system F domain protein [Lactobacillus selangorensis]|uniref:Bacterial type II secretion system F domain protein n=2 Tax=Lactobacillus selangorensis TaxID=81857 RepID=A0A0R2FGQ1_9LACO|nr:bacterial type II secretion system F domain protein [Lactobacillus selangorensis]KRN30323.1 bacterial type II secretion system F domain protein [Lactobacillus selangorensis]